MFFFLDVNFFIKFLISIKMLQHVTGNFHKDKPTLAHYFLELPSLGQCIRMIQYVTAH